ncbi:hypothetical protein Q5752_003419 [Cryptotrichosporon argae]
MRRALLPPSLPTLVPLILPVFLALLARPAAARPALRPRADAAQQCCLELASDNVVLSEITVRRGRSPEVAEQARGWLGGAYPGGAHEAGRGDDTHEEGGKDAGEAEGVEEGEGSGKRDTFQIGETEAGVDLPEVCLDLLSNIDLRRALDPALALRDGLCVDILSGNSVLSGDSVL